MNHVPLVGGIAYILLSIRATLANHVNLCVEEKRVYHVS